MEQFKKLRDDLNELGHLVNGLNISLDMFPPYLLSTDLYSFLNEIQYMKGYVDCMLKFNVQPPLG